MEPVVLAEHDRRAPAEDHARARRPPAGGCPLRSGGAGSRPGGRTARGDWVGPSGIACISEASSRWAGVSFASSGPSRSKHGSGPLAAAGAGRRPLQEGDAEPLRQRRGDHAAARAVRGRHGDQPDRSELMISSSSHAAQPVCANFTRRRRHGRRRAVLRSEHARPQHQPADDRGGRRRSRPTTRTRRCSCAPPRWPGRPGWCPCVTR